MKRNMICLGQKIAGERVTRVLERAGELHGFPKTIVVNNGPEFTSKARAKTHRPTRSARSPRDAFGHRRP